MKDHTMKTELMPVPFYGDTLVLVNEEGTPFVAMRAIVENMGLAWQVQHRKLTEKFGATVTIMVTVGEDGRNREMVCLPLRKLPAWLYSVNPNKVAPELRDKIIQYQNECDDALWDYWTKGQATRPGLKGADRLSQVIKAGDRAAALVKQIRHEQDPNTRQYLYNVLQECSQVLGMNTPALDSLTPLLPQDPPAVVQFWQVVQALETVHQVELNHARRAGLVALALKQVMDAAHAHGLSVDEWVRQALRHSASRPFVGVRTVNSAITGKSVKCWVFQETPQALLH